tara:strand:- start:515 stop:850 length:336 start_codon:yes stop_codon:yes gene_type:complete
MNHGGGLGDARLRVPRGVDLPRADVASAAQIPAKAAIRQPDHVSAKFRTAQAHVGALTRAGRQGGRARLPLGLPEDQPAHGRRCGGRGRRRGAGPSRPSADRPAYRREHEK